MGATSWPICCRSSPPTRTLPVQIDQPWGRLSWLIMNQAQPPFNDVRIRRATMMAVRQEDYMRATFGDDQSLWRVSKDVFPFGTPYYTGADGGRDARRPDAGGRKC